MSTVEVQVQIQQQQKEMNQIERFFDNQRLRIHYDDKETWFCGYDVCKLLGYSRISKDGKIIVDTNQTLKKLPNNYKKAGTKILNSRGESRESIFINGKGVIRLAYRSNLKNEMIEKFQEWVDEVIEKVMTEGKYELPVQINNDKYVNAMIQKIESETKMIQIETQNKAMKIFEEKGDDRSAIVCVDNIKNIIRSSTTNQLMIEDKSRLNTLSERIYNHMNLKPSRELTNKINSLGGKIAPMYRKKYNSEPKHNIQECKGHETRVKCYSIQDYEEWIDQEIKKFLNL